MVDYDMEMLWDMNMFFGYSIVWDGNILVGYVLVMEICFCDCILILFFMFELFDGVVC